MDDVTTLLKTLVCTTRILITLEEVLTWSKMTIKLSKSHSVSIRKGAKNDLISFSVDGERTPLLAEQPVWSLGKLYMFWRKE